VATVLVVDDNPDACKMMARLVAQCGHDGVCVTSGEAALEFVHGRPVDLIILDNMMPGIDGIEVLRRLRADPSTAALPVVMWSAVAEREFVDHARRKGATDYWVKATFSYANLSGMLGRVLAGGCDG
jgi:CheY-like chemotaxis protein